MEDPVSVFLRCKTTDVHVSLHVTNASGFLEKVWEVRGKKLTIKINYLFFLLLAAKLDFLHTQATLNYFDACTEYGVALKAFAFVSSTKVSFRCSSFPYLHISVDDPKIMQKPCGGRKKNNK